MMMMLGCHFSKEEKACEGLEIRDKMIMSPNVILDPQHGIRESFINGRWR
jgi:hypothetical protein